MITIRIQNHQDILEREKSWLITRFAHHFIDVKAKVEEAIARQIQKSLEERSIQAIVTVVKD